MTKSSKPPVLVAALDLSSWPQIGFAAFGEIEVKPLSRIQKLVGSFLSRNWVMVPHVTHQDEADTR